MRTNSTHARRERREKGISARQQKRRKQRAKWGGKTGKKEKP